MEILKEDCQIRFCKSGKVADHYASETIDDGSFSLLLCGDCFEKLNLPFNGADIPEVDEVERLVNTKMIWLVNPITG